MRIIHEVKFGWALRVNFAKRTKCINASHTLRHLSVRTASIQRFNLFLWKQIADRVLLRQHKHFKLIDLNEKRRQEMHTMLTYQFYPHAKEVRPVLTSHRFVNQQLTAKYENVKMKNFDISDSY